MQAAPFNRCATRELTEAFRTFSQGLGEEQLQPTYVLMIAPLPKQIHMQYCLLAYSSQEIGG